MLKNIQCRHISRTCRRYSKRVTLKRIGTWPIHRRLNSQFRTERSRCSHGECAASEYFTQTLQCACCRWNVYATFQVRRRPVNQRRAECHRCTAGICWHGVSIFHGYAGDAGERVPLKVQATFQAWRSRPISDELNQPTLQHYSCRISQLHACAEIIRSNDRCEHVYTLLPLLSCDTQHITVLYLANSYGENLFAWKLVVLDNLHIAECKFTFYVYRIISQSLGQSSWNRLLQRDDITRCFVNQPQHLFSRCECRSAYLRLPSKHHVQPTLCIMEPPSSGQYPLACQV